MFLQAKPIWATDKENEMNLTLLFEATVTEAKNAQLYLSASTFYRVFINGRFLAFGPARTARGYARVDILPLDCKEGKTHIRIEVTAYNCRSLSTCLQPGFLCAEVRCGDRVIACTGRDFSARIHAQRLQYTERFSIQRHFGEILDLTLPDTPTVPTQILSNPPVFLPRVAPYPHYEDILPVCASQGSFTFDESLPYRENYYSWKEIPVRWGRFEPQQIPHKPFRWIQRQAQTLTAESIHLPVTLQAGEYVLFDFSRVECGFLTASLTTQSESDVVIGFSEYCEGKRFSFTRLNCQNVLEYFLPAHTAQSLQSFEPYTARFAILMVKRGSITLSAFGIKTFERDMTGAVKPAFSNPVHRGIYEAALRTFAHNAVDLYSDCPSRERAGWLCDSYFTGTAEHHFFGKVPVEDAFLENYRLFHDPILDNGMLPMCYPADVKREESGIGHHIPQWCMWYVLEVEEYLTKRNKTVDPALFRPSVEGILSYLEKHENEDGLLENLPSWNFVEWSDANSWTQNVNYPTNFLYAEVLSAACRLYGDTTLAQKAHRLRERTVALSFDGELFTDNAVRREDGRLHNTGNTSEAGQYYALLFGNIDLDAPTYQKLKKHVLEGCRGVDTSTRKFVPVNAFIGLYLRLKTLLKLEQYQLLLDEVGDFFGHMAEKTGTLWEYREMKGSFDHGFASYAAYAMCVALEKLK